MITTPSPEVRSLPVQFACYTALWNVPREASPYSLGCLKHLEDYRISGVAVLLRFLEYKIC